MSHMQGGQWSESEKVRGAGSPLAVVEQIVLEHRHKSLTKFPGLDRSARGGPQGRARRPCLCTDARSAAWVPAKLGEYPITTRCVRGLDFHLGGDTFQLVPSCNVLQRQQLVF